MLTSEKEDPKKNQPSVIEALSITSDISYLEFNGAIRYMKVLSKKNWGTQLVLVYLKTK